MKRYIFVFAIMMVILTACGSGATAAATLDSGEQTGTSTVAVPSLAPTATLDASATPAPTATTPATPTEAPTVTDTPTSEPTPTPTPVPVDLVWYWAIEGDSNQVTAVNQLGEVRALGSLTLSGDESIRVFPLDSERGLMFVITSSAASAYLLTPDRMQAIDLGESESLAVSEDVGYSLDVVGWAKRYVMLSFITQTSYSTMPDIGPTFLIDLQTLTTAPLDEKVCRLYISLNSSWFHTSPDGRYLRYLSGDKKSLEVRELDLETGLARTVAVTTGSPYKAYPSQAGDLWYLENSHEIVSVDGRQVAFDDSSMTFRPLDGDRGLVFYETCTDNCPIKVFSPFDNQTGPAYTLPWGLLDWAFDQDADQLLPDQSLLMLGSSHLQLGGEQALLKDYPALGSIDPPIFRLTADGQAELLGIYLRMDPYVMPVSPDEHYLILQAADRSNYFLYDTLTGKRLFEIPMDPALDYKYFVATYMKRGVILNLVAQDLSDATSPYQYFYYVFDYFTGAFFSWEDPSSRLANCQGLEADETLICWSYRNDDSVFYDIVRFDPATGAKTPLLENVWLIYNY